MDDERYRRALFAAAEIAPDADAVTLALIVRAVLDVMENERVRLVPGSGWR